jgi:hypothetical protein
MLENIQFLSCVFCFKFSWIQILFGNNFWNKKRKIKKGNRAYLSLSAAFRPSWPAYLLTHPHAIAAQRQQPAHTARPPSSSPLGLLLFPPWAQHTQWHRRGLTRRPSRPRALLLSPLTDQPAPRIIGTSISSSLDRARVRLKVDEGPCSNSIFHRILPCWRSPLPL